MIELLDEYLDSCNVSISITKKAGIITVSLLPKTKEGKEMNVIPLNITGTLSEVRESLPSSIKEAFGGAREHLANISDFLDGVKKAADKAETSAASKSTSTSSSKTASSTKATETKKEETKPVKVVYTPEQKKAIKTIDEKLERAAKSTDPGRRQFARKEVLAIAAENKLDASVIDHINKLLPDAGDIDLFSGTAQDQEAQAEHNPPPPDNPPFQPDADKPEETKQAVEIKEEKPAATKATKTKAASKPAETKAAEVKPAEDKPVETQLIKQEYIKTPVDGKPNIVIPDAATTSTLGPDDEEEDNPDQELQTEDQEEDPKEGTGDGPATAAAEEWL